MPNDVAADALRTLFRRDEGAQHWFRDDTGATSLECAGLKTRTPPVPVARDTTFHCFSTTKTVTALAIMQLVGRGLVSLDAPLTRYLPRIPYQNGATLRQVLSHQAGIPSPMPLSWVHTDDAHATFDRAAFLARVLEENPTCTAPGQRVRYSNVGFLLLGAVIEAVSGERYEDYVRTNILDVIGHVADGYLDFEIPRERHATGYTKRWSPIGALVSMMPDDAHLQEVEPGYIRYRPFHLNGASYGGLKGNALGWAPLLTAVATRDPRLLGATLFDEMFRPQSLSNGKPTGHALAWFTGRTKAGVDYLSHAGGGPGYGAEIRVYPALRAASVLLTNTTFIRDTRFLDDLDAPSLRARASTSTRVAVAGV